MSGLQDRLTDALYGATAHYANLLGEPFGIDAVAGLADDPVFWALVELKDDGLAIHVSRGVIEQTDDLWREALDAADPDFASTMELDREVRASLVWLIFHEMQHFDLRHFDLLDRAAIGETLPPESLGLVSRRTTVPRWLAHLNTGERLRVERCLEMQADHDAIECLLDAYGSEGWDTLRQRAAAISAMMVLIERADAGIDHDRSSHPKAATRIFQLIGHLIDMPTIPARMKAFESGADRIDPDDLPSDEEQMAYMRAVALPAYRDAVHLAKIANAESIARDLGDAAKLFVDIQNARLHGADALTMMHTEGGREWADLTRLNRDVLTKLGFNTPS